MRFRDVVGDGCYDLDLQNACAEPSSEEIEGLAGGGRPKAHGTGSMWWRVPPRRAQGFDGTARSR